MQESTVVKYVAIVLMCAILGIFDRKRINSDFRHIIDGVNGGGGIRTVFRAKGVVVFFLFFTVDVIDAVYSFSTERVFPPILSATSSIACVGILVMYAVAYFLSTRDRAGNGK